MGGHKEDCGCQGCRDGLELIANAAAVVVAVVVAKNCEVEVVREKHWGLRGRQG